MATIDELKQRIDLHDLADWLGLERPGGQGNYRSPFHADKAPSLSIYDGGRKWHDHSRGVGGSCIDIVCQVRGVEVSEAIVILHEWQGIPLDKPERSGEPREKTRAEYIAERCLAQPGRAIEYLVSPAMAGRRWHSLRAASTPATSWRWICATWIPS